MSTGTDIPRRLGDRYEVGEVLGRGGMAEVHLSRDSRLGRLVAVKMLRPDLARDPVFQARFRREAHSAAALNHPSVVAVYDTGEDAFTAPGGVEARVPYIVMEYVEGQTAKELLHSVGDGQGGSVGAGLGTERAAEITAGVLTALDYSHRQGIIHRDIKPANVMVTPDGVVKVMDFGIARALADTSATMTQTSAVIGTAQYLSPEQARGETVDARTDLYSTGCLLYELLTGRPPFVGDSPVSVAYQHVREVPVPPSRLNPAVPDALDRVVLKALAKDREDRYANAEEFRRDLLAAAGGRPVGAPPVGTATAMATQALPSSTEATQALAAAGLGGAAGLAATTPMTAPMTAPMTRRQAAEQTRLDAYAASGPATGRGYGAEDLTSRSWAEQQDEPPRRRTGAVIGITLAVLAALALLGVVLWNLLGTGDDPPAVPQVAVPSVVTLEENDARGALAAAGLRWTEQRVEDPAEAGTVIDQDPDGGAMVDDGSSVSLTISSGPAAVAVPDVTGQSESQARDNLERAGLQPGDLTEEASADVAEGRVIRTDPPAASQVAPDTQVNLVISTGQVELAEYTGRNVLEAQQELLRQGFEVSITPEETAEFPDDTVLRQDPPAGLVAPGSTITLVVAAAPQQPTETPSESPTDGESPTGDGDGGDESPSPSETLSGEDGNGNGRGNGRGNNDDD